MKINLYLLGGLLVAASTLGTSRAEAGENVNYNTQRLVIECKGYIGERFVVFFETSMVPNEPKTAESSLEIGLVVKRWQAMHYEYVQDAKGVQFALEGAISGGGGAYKIGIPDLAMMVDQKTTNFSTSVALKGSYTNGSFAMNCSAKIRNIKTKATVSND